jgi:phage tail sheath protein FI
MVGLADRGVVTGPITADLAVTSLADFTSKYGARQSYSVLYDAVEAFFAEGGNRVFISRYAGPAATKASAAVPVAGTKFTATAKSVGAWGNNLTVGVASGVITVYENGTPVEVSPAQADVTAAQAWSTGSRYIDVTPVGSGALTDTVPVALTGGADDRVNATDTQRQAALDRFARSLGPGQVLLPGDTRTQAHQMLAAHANANNRFALLDAPDTATASTIIATAGTDRALGRDQARHAQLLAPWVTAPGTVSGTTRSIPPSAVQAGMIARSDSTTGNPNRAVAGANGISRFATGVKATFTDTDRSSLADAGVNVILSTPDAGVLTYDDVTLVDPALNPEWLGAGGNREIMSLISDALGVAGAHMFAQNEGPLSLDAFNGDLKAVCLQHKARGSLYGATPEEAFRVETGSTVNTPTSIQNRQLKAAVAVKISPNNRQVTVQITNRPLTAAL